MQVTNGSLVDSCSRKCTLWSVIVVRRTKKEHASTDNTKKYKGKTITIHKLAETTAAQAKEQGI